jgi:hypothetical protein
MKKILYWGVADLEWPVNLTLIWCCLLGTSELIHLFVRGKTAVIILNMLAATIEKLDTQVTWHVEFLHCCAIWTWNTNFCLNFGITLYLELTCSLESYNMVTGICFSTGSCFRVDHLHSIKLSDGIISCCTTWLFHVIPVFCMGISLMIVSFLLTSYYLTHYLNCFEKFEFKPVTKWYIHLYVLP